MGHVFDEKDYRQRLDALDSSNISLGDEISDIGSGWAGLINPFTRNSAAIGSGPLDARKTILEAKQNALRQARKEMIRAIIKAEQDQAFNGGLPTEVEQIVTGQSDKLIKV
jgi:hypothetical protein